MNYNIVIILFITICMIPFVQGSEISIDATDMNEWGENEEPIYIGELKYREEIEVEFENIAEYTNISLEIIEVGMMFNNEIKGYINLYADNTSSSQMTPGENMILSYKHDNYEKIEIGLLFTTYFNESATNEQQKNVKIRFEYKILDDSGNTIFTTEEENNDQDNDNDNDSNRLDPPSQTNNDESNDEETSPLQALPCLIIIIGIIIIIVLYNKNKQKKEKKDNEKEKGERRK